MLRRLKELLISLFGKPVTTYYDEHYSKLHKQPIEIMQDELTPEEFIGFLKGNMIKYKSRAGLKKGEPYLKDKTKYDRYKYWLSLAQQGKRIDPRV